MMLRCVFCGERVCASKAAARRAAIIGFAIATITAVAIATCSVM